MVALVAVALVQVLLLVEQETRQAQRHLKEIMAALGSGKLELAVVVGQAQQGKLATPEEAIKAATVALVLHRLSLALASLMLGAVVVVVH